MPPANPTSGLQNGSLSGELYSWSKQDGTGLFFDSSTGFTFQNGAMRAPDTSWILRERWDAVPDDDKLRFSHIAPDFVVELRSPSDTVAMLQAKMAEYIQNGVQLGWLIDPFLKQVHIYRSGQPVEVLDGPEIVSGDPVLPGFVLNLQEIW
jgi:Uma2 family endonuclease